MPNPIERWDQAKILEEVKTTGKSLEVECAMKFRASNAQIQPAGLELAPSWELDLSSYYRDDVSEKNREIDVIATRTSMQERPSGPINTFVKAFVSCKGFPADAGPVMCAMHENKTPEVIFGDSQSHGFSNDFASEAARNLLSAIGLRPEGTSIPAIVSYHVLKEKEGPAGTFNYSRDREREKDVFEQGMDTAIKAAIWWRWLTFPTHVHAAGAFVPIMVTEKPWWQFPVGTGVVESPALKSRGFMVNTYPITRERKRPPQVTSIICAKGDLDAVIDGLEVFGDWFGAEAARHFRGGAR